MFRDCFEDFHHENLSCMYNILVEACHTTLVDFEKKPSDYGININM